jgi:hypothetical protein
MKFDAKEITDAVADMESDRADWRRAAEIWERMWKLKRTAEGTDRYTSKEVDEVESITTADPFNIVQLVQRFVASDLRLDVPYLSAEDDDDERSETMEEWATSFWQRACRQQGRNLTDDMTWFSAVRGRGIVHTSWVYEALKDMGLQDRRLPILPRILDPFNAGVKRGPYWADYGYHQYSADTAYIKQMYPKFQFDDARRYTWQKGKTKYKVIDFYWLDKGSIWNAVSVNGKFAKNPVKTDYPELPLIEWYADGAPLDDELSKSLGILHPIADLWPYKCELASAIGTGLLYYFDPIVKAIGFNKEIEVEPGAVINLTKDQDIDFVRGEPNVPMADKMLQLIQTSMDQSTFPAVLYGEQPGGVQAGFAINNLATQARNRVKTIRGNLEGALEAVFEQVFAIVEIMGDEKGVDVWGGSTMTDRSRPIHLDKDIIKGNYATEVSLIPEIPTDETGRIQIWLQMVKEGIVSKATMRNRAINVPLPRDEETRIQIEKAMEDPALAPKVTLRAMQKRFSRDTWELLIAGTPLENAEQQEAQWRAQKKEQRQQAKEQRRMEKLMAAAAANPQPALPPGPMSMGPGGPPPMGPSTGAPMMPPGGAPSPMDFGTDFGAPEPESMQPPGLTNIPPQAAGQLSRADLGVTPQSPPGAFQQAVGGEQLPPNEILDRLRNQGGATL